MSNTHSCMMLESTSYKLDQLIPKIRYLTDTCTSKITTIDWIFCKLSLTCIDHSLTIFCLAVGNALICPSLVPHPEPGSFLISSERSNDSILIPYFCNLISSNRTILNAIKDVLRHTLIYQIHLR